MEFVIITAINIIRPSCGQLSAEGSLILRDGEHKFAVVIKLTDFVSHFPVFLKLML
jgi:hypothetical protein